MVIWHFVLFPRAVEYSGVRGTKLKKWNLWLFISFRVPVLRARHVVGTYEGGLRD